MNTLFIWSVGGLAFVLLCCFCVYQHAPSLSAMKPSEAEPEQLITTNLDARLLDGRVALRGTLPDAAAKNQLLARAKELYGDGKIVETVRLNRQSAFPHAKWFQQALDLLPLAAKAKHEGGFTLDGKTLVLRGTVDSEDARAKLVSQATSIAGNSLRVEDKLLVKGKAPVADK